MKSPKLLQMIALAGGLFMAASPVLAAVQVTQGPTALVTAEQSAPASSPPIGLYKFSLSQNANETLLSVGVNISPAASSTLPASHLSSVSLYKAAGPSFNPATDTLIGSQNSINLSGLTTIPVNAPTIPSGACVVTLFGKLFNVTPLQTGHPGGNIFVCGTDMTTTYQGQHGTDLTRMNPYAIFMPGEIGASTSPTTYFLAISTGAGWSGVSPADAFTTTLPVNAITTSANSPSTTIAATAKIFAVAPIPTAPALVSAVAKNTGSTPAKEPGDSIELTFSQSTNKPVINAANLMNNLTVNNGHTLLDSGGNLGATSWNSSGTVLTLTLSGNASNTVANIVPGDTISLATTTDIIDSISSLKATGSSMLTGDFGQTTPPPSNDCANGILNNRIYQLQNTTSFFVSYNCELYPISRKQLRKIRSKKLRTPVVIGSLSGLNVVTDAEVEIKQRGNGSRAVLVVKIEKHDTEDENEDRHSLTASLGLNLGLNTRQADQNAQRGENENRENGRRKDD